MKRRRNVPRTWRPSPINMGIHGDLIIRLDASEGAISSDIRVAHPPHKKIFALRVHELGENSEDMHA
jgi:hypothetical protein